MAKFITTTIIRGLFKSGEKIPPDTLIELNPKNPAHARLIQGGDVKPYVPPKEPATYGGNNGNGNTQPAKPPKSIQQMSTEELTAYADTIGITLNGDEKHADILKLVKAKLDE